MIIFEENSFYQLIDELPRRIIREVEKRYTEKEWLSEIEAKEL